MSTSNELVAYLNGEYLPITQCKISVMDIGITNGASVTDFTRTFNQKLFRKIWALLAEPAKARQKTM